MGFCNRIIIGAGVGMLLTAAAAYGAPVDVKLVGAQGDVSYMKSAGGAWEKAPNGTLLKEGAKVKTGAGASCLLSIGGHAVKVGALTVTVIDKSDLEGTTSKAQVGIESGKVFAKVGKLSNKNSTFSVRTPTAVAGVRGSEIMVTVGEEQSSFQVTEGSFSVEAEGVAAILDQNFQVDVEPGAPPAEPEAIPEVELQELKAEIDDIKTEIQESGIVVESAAPQEGEGKESLTKEGEAKESETKEAEAKEEAKDESAETSAVDVLEDVVDNQIIKDITEQQIETLEPGTGNVEIVIE